ncbi:hypothetical protein JKF63_05498 [Porcisia hertigi]|uniref:ubiquitinyl hydrolase 1 n=1 Tax=Porcisia hertigi TaxID=2761500 RepID=A0A836HYU8_9TRYP|nr:hypothetical protein JKF63_05498 [Porcisia hertigi]
MSHGRRMLEAQAQKERRSGTCDDGRIDDGHLRNNTRALNDDGTPVRPSRGSARPSVGDRGEDDRHEDPLLLSPLPRPNVLLRFSRSVDGSSSVGSATTGAGSVRGDVRAEIPHHQPRISGIGLYGAAPLVSGPVAVSRRRHSSEVTDGTRVSAARHMDVDGEERYGDGIDRGTRATVAEAMTRSSTGRSTGDTRNNSRAGVNSGQQRGSPEVRSRSRAGSGGNSAAGCLRYPASRVNVSAPVETSSGISLCASNCLARGRTESRSPPLVTSGRATSCVSQLHPSRAAPLPPAPITAALCRSSDAGYEAAPDPRTTTAAGMAHSAHRPPSQRREPSMSTAGSSGLTSAMASTAKASLITMSMPMPPASPPLRAGVSPRMLPLHPTRVDASNASVFVSRAASANTVTTTVVTTPSSSQAPLPLQAGSQVSPCELQQHQQPLYSIPSTPPATPPSSCHVASVPSRSVRRHDMSDLAGDAVEEDCGGSGAALHSLPRSSPPPLPQKGESARVAAGPDWRSPLSSPQATSAEAPVRPYLPDLSEATGPFDEFDMTPLTKSLDRRHYPFMADFSGFHNTGNDCYGCSLLTMLLRSSVFRRALLASPLVFAVRRYEALLTGRTERRVLWSSGYTDAAEDAGTRTTASGRKRTRGPVRPTEDIDNGVQSEGVSVAAACGRSDTAPKVQAEPPASSHYVWRPTAAVQHTLNVLDTFSLVELEDALDVDLETQRVPATLHSALAALARAQRWREHMTTLVNTPRTQSSERQRILETRIYHDNDRDFDGQVYTYGIRLNAIAKLFDGEFFLGDQEDAHELFVSVIAKLEMEALRFQQRCNEILEHRTTASSTVGSDKGEEGNDEVQSEDRSSNGGKGVDVAETPLSHTAYTHRASFMGPPDVVASPACAGAASSRTQHRLSVSQASAEVWINPLVQTSLLNIIRCRAGECHHEIITDEICVNLSVNIPEVPLTSPPPALPLPAAPSCFPELPPPLPSPPMFSLPSIPTAAAVETSLPVVDGCDGGRCRSLADLLHDSMAYEELNEYRCDSCGSRTSQFQGGCFYSCPPPLLVLQLKRFATQFLNGTVIIHKNSSRVAVEDTLMIHALPSAAELRAWQRRPKPDHCRIPDCVVPTEATETEQGTRVEHCAAPTNVTKTASSACVRDAFCSSYYDSDEKRFSAALREAYDVSGGDGAAGQHGVQDMHDYRKHDHSATTLSSATPSSSLVWAIRCVYRLRSCVLHLGPSLHYGHYVSDFAVDGEESCEDKPNAGERGTIERKEEEEEENNKNNRGIQSQTPLPSPQTTRRRWRRANDERVEVLSEKVVQTHREGSSDTYLLLYEKIAEEYVRCPAEAVLPMRVYSSGKGGDV